MMSMKIKDKLSKFLNNLKEIKGSALILSSYDMKEEIFDEIKKFYAREKIRVIDSNLDDKEAIDKSFNTSLKEGSVLLITMEKQTSHVVTRRLEQVMNDGYIPVNIGNNWLKVEPVDTWQAIVWVNQDAPHKDEKILRNLFAHKLVVTP
jgi:hypothetical protein